MNPLTLKAMPDKQAGLNIIKLLIELREKANPKTDLGISIINALDDINYSDKEVLDFVRNQAKNSFKTMSEAIGSDLCNDIINL